MAAVFGAGESLVFAAGEVVAFALGEACGLGEGEGDFLGAANVATGAQQAMAAMNAVMIWDLFFIVLVVLGTRF